MMQESAYLGGIKWRREAACQGLDSEMFYNPDRFNEGKVICDFCPVRISCLAYALTIREQYGVWGGRTPEERRKLARRIRSGRAFDHDE